MLSALASRSIRSLWLLRLSKIPRKRRSKVFHRDSKSIFQAMVLSKHHDNLTDWRGADDTDPVGGRTYRLRQRDLAREYKANNESPTSAMKFEYVGIEIS